MEIINVGVIGAGTMGNGIAHVLAKYGHTVLLVDIEQRFLDRGLETIRKNLEREVGKEKITAEVRDAADRQPDDRRRQGQHLQPVSYTHLTLPTKA